MREPTRCPVPHRVLAACVSLLGALAFPALAPASHGVQYVGNPKLYVLTAKLAMPYDPAFNLQTGFSGWPALQYPSIDYLHEDQRNASGALDLDHTYDTSGSLFNEGYAHADDSGVFGSDAHMLDFWPADPSLANPYPGVFCFAQLSQSFRKDSANATLSFTISKCGLYVKSVAVDAARAEFATQVWGYSGTSQFFHFSQKAGVEMSSDGFGQGPYVKDIEGPMLSYTETQPDGVNNDHQIDFSSFTQDIDISGVGIGEEFTIASEEMTQASVLWGEWPEAYAYFRDPLHTGTGMQIEFAGMTPTDNPVVPALAVDPWLPGTSAALSAGWPNPLRSSVSFRLDMPRAGDATVAVFDLSGRRVATLVRGSLPAGPHTFTWNGRDERGGRASAGVYFVRAGGPGMSLARRVVKLDE